MNCVECDHQCYEYFNNGACDKAYYEWTLKQDKCDKEEKESEVKANEP